MGILTLGPAAAQQSQPATKPAPQPYGGGTPLDVILHTRYWTDVPDMRDFVKAARPAEGSLQFTPTGGTEPKRPPLRNATQLQQMQNELENAGAHSEQIAGFTTRHFQTVAPPPKKK